jgi:isopentenyldiphosphate isomerase
MISEEFRRKFTEELGIKHYTSKVQKILEDKQIYTNRGAVASARTINNVFGGHQEDENIELAINEVYEQELIKKEQLQKLRAKHT